MPVTIHTRRPLKHEWAKGRRGNPLVVQALVVQDRDELKRRSFINRSKPSGPLADAKPSARQIEVGLIPSPVPARAPVKAPQVSDLAAVGDTLKHQLAQGSTQGVLLPQRRGGKHHPLLQVYGG